MRHPLAARRILRLALGGALCLWFSQAINWPLSFIAPAFTILILALPLPTLGLKKGIGFIVALIAPMIAGMALLPVLVHARWAGILLLGLALFYTFYYTARGGSAVLGTFMTVGLTLVTTIGSVNSELLVVLVQTMAVCAVVGLAFVWLAHLLVPDPPPGPSLPAFKPPVPPVPGPAEVQRRALRSLCVVFPLTLAFLFMSGSAAYTVVMIKVASLGQQATSSQSRALGRSLLESTFWGGVAAIIAWYTLQIWPSLTLYTLLFGLAGLYFGRGIFQGPAVGPKFSMWSYAYLTMLIILAPSVLDSPLVARDANAAFWLRFFLIVLVAVWGSIAVAVFDAFAPEREERRDPKFRSHNPLKGQ
ncbi:MAG: DUF2955 domain-containing protein [Xanthomonadales bacterium]|nr:DUF2955 domain-containing protein [Xanthomonadales bacterium]